MSEVERFCLLLPCRILFVIVTPTHTHTHVVDPRQAREKTIFFLPFFFDLVVSISLALTAKRAIACASCVLRGHCACIRWSASAVDAVGLHVHLWRVPRSVPHRRRERRLLMSRFLPLRRADLTRPRFVAATWSSPRCASRATRSTASPSAISSASYVCRSLSLSLCVSLGLHSRAPAPVSQAFTEAEAKEAAAKYEVDDEPDAVGWPCGIFNLG